MRFWDVGSGSELAVLKGHAKPITSVAFMPGGNQLAAANRDGTIRLWSVAEAREVAAWLAETPEIAALAFSPDGRTLATGGANGDVTFWDVGTRKEWNSLEAHSKQITALAFSPSGEFLATASDDSSLKLWDCITGQMVHNLVGHSTEVTAATFTPDGHTILSAGLDQLVRVWYVESGVLRGTLGFAPDDGPRSGAEPIPGTTPVGKSSAALLAAAGSDPRIQLWNVTDPQSASNAPPVVSFSGHTLDVNAVAFSPDGAFLASASADKTIRIWNIESEKNIAAITGHAGEVTALRVRPERPADRQWFVGRAHQVLGRV